MIFCQLRDALQSATSLDFIYLFVKKWLNEAIIEVDCAAYSCTSHKRKLKR